MKVVVIGAGPTGLVAAVAAAQRGLDVTVLEQGEPGDALRCWGATRLFTPLGMNLPPSVRALLDADGVRLPPEDALITGPEMADRVLAPLARLPLLDRGARVRSRHCVLAVGRARLLRHELVGHPLRFERPFNLLVETPDGEQTLQADRVLDASGVYGQPCWAGAGGLPARGERALGDRIVRDLGTLHARRASLGGKRLLLVGHGHSAANAVALLDEIARAARGTHVTWAVRSANARPCQEVCSDPLPERQAVAANANALASAPPAHLTVQRRASIERLVLDGEAVRVTLTGDRSVTVDEVVALTGYRPDLAMLSELALDLSPVTEGAGRLARAIANVTDCLSVPKVSDEDLASGEPGFHLIGAKSYGRSRTFLLSTGYGQLARIVAAL
jgi:thioredoxin reductase